MCFNKSFFIFSSQSSQPIFLIFFRNYFSKMTVRWIWFLCWIVLHKPQRWFWVKPPSHFQNARNSPTQLSVLMSSLSHRDAAVIVSRFWRPQSTFQSAELRQNERLSRLDGSADGHGFWGDWRLSFSSAFISLESDLTHECRTVKRVGSK